MHVLAGFTVGAVLARAAGQLHLRRPWLNVGAGVVVVVGGALAARLGVHVVEALWPILRARPASSESSASARFLAASFADVFIASLVAAPLEGRSLPRDASSWSWTVVWPLVVLLLAANGIETQAAQRVRAQRGPLFSERTGLRRHHALQLDLDGPLATGVSFTLVYLDLDGFKRVNDTLGHDAGDEVLAAVARALEGADRVAYHISGDEFVALIPGHDEGRVRQFAIHAHQAVAEIGAQRGVELGASLGAYRVSSHGGLNAREARRAADVAMLRAKEAGRGRLAFDSGAAIALGPRRSRMKGDRATKAEEAI